MDAIDRRLKHLIDEYLSAVLSISTIFLNIS